MMKKKIKSEIFTLILLMIVVFELAVLVFDYYFNPMSEYDYLFGSVFFIGLICMITCTHVQTKFIYRLIDAIDNK